VVTTKKKKKKKGGRGAAVLGKGARPAKRSGSCGGKGEIRELILNHEKTRAIREKGHALSRVRFGTRKRERN